MKVLIISKLAGNEWQGPTHSVPKQVHSLTAFDDVLWINLCKTQKDDWKHYSYYYEPVQGKNVRLTDLPEGFRFPDIVLFQGVYEYPFTPIIFDLWKMNIPYILVPRSALTIQAQKKRALKKALGNFVFFNRFIRKARSILYLTDAEKSDSVSKTYGDSVVIPNGANVQNAPVLSSPNPKNPKICYIGRLEKYQKGLDLLVEAVYIVAAELRTYNATLHLYGPNRENSLKDVNILIEQYKLSDIIYIHNGVFGKEKENVLQKADAFIMSSRFEGLPMGLIEALSYGVPCIITSGTNMVDVVKEGQAGWCCQTTAISIAEGIRNMLQESNIDDMRKNAVELAKQYDWNTIGRHTHEFFDQIVKII